MDVRERLLTAMTWGEPDRVPLTIYDWMLPRGTTERTLRELGVGLVARLAGHQVRHREVEFITREYWENGEKRIRRTIHTPVGDVWQTLLPEGAYETSTWIKENFIKRPEDYKVMEFVVRDAVYTDNYANIREAQRRLGGDGIVYLRLAKAPIQEMIYQMLGMEQFAMDFHFHRDLFDSLHAAMLERYEELYDYAAGSPAELILMADNITSDVVGDGRYRQYCLPVYEKVRARLAGTGKRVMVHMDGRLASIKKAIAESQFDIIEAITPPPMGDVSIAEARQIWPDKALWINFLSSAHIESSEFIESHTRQILEEAGTKRGFAIGITEDAPVEALERSLAVIGRVLRDY